MRQIAKIILVNSDNKILLVLRDDKPEIPYPNYWSEIGGEIEKGETPLEALKREIREEVSCEVENITPLGEFIDSELEIRVIMFKGTFSEKLENIRLYEGQKLGLFNFKEINELKIPPLIKELIIQHKRKIFGI